MGQAAYNRASAVISARIDRELAESKIRAFVPRCFCGVARHDEWTAGVHHTSRGCHRIINEQGPSTFLR